MTITFTSKINRFTQLCCLVDKESISTEAKFQSRYGRSSNYSVSQKTSPTFLAITRESIVGCLAYMLPRK